MEYRRAVVARGESSTQINMTTANGTYPTIFAIRLGYENINLHERLCQLATPPSLHRSPAAARLLLVGQNPDEG